MRSPFLAICLEHLVFIIGKALTLLHLMTILYTRWMVSFITYCFFQSRILLGKKVMKKLVKKIVFTFKLHCAEITSL